MKRIFVVIIISLQAACATTDLSTFQTLKVTPAEFGNTTDVQGLPIRSGQVIVSEATYSLSFMMNLMSSDYAPFGHAGIVVHEPDGVFVYEAFGFLNFRFWKPPTRRLNGKIRRVPLVSFLERNRISAIYQHRNTDLDAIADFAREAFSSKLAFDGVFDYRTDDRVYCSEFVAAALESAGHAPIELVPRTDNRSMRRMMTWLEVDAPAFILAANLLDNAEEVARISERYSERQIEAHFAFERELHQRFGEDQTLSNIFRWTMKGPRIRSHLQELRDDIIDGADAATEPATWVASQVKQALEQGTDDLQASIALMDDR